MIEVSEATLGEALRKGLCVDGSSHVLSDRTIPATSSRLGTPPILAPFEQAAFQAEAPKKPATPPPDRLTLEQFERLSLAARAVMAQTPCAGISLRADSGQALAPLFPVLNTEVLLKAIALAVEEIEGGGQDVIPQVRAGLRNGVQIIGCRITGRAVKRGKLVGDELPLRLANLRIPFSLRFIGCVIDSPIIANHCEMQTLDLSGSAVAGLDGASLHTRGNVRLRRSTVLSPANFGGAHVEGVFDASDCVMQPRLEQPRGEAFAAERGMLNLGQGRFENDVYLNRARIWGGLTLRGAVMERSLFLNEAVIRSPVAVLERLGCEHIEPYVKGDSVKVMQAEVLAELKSLIGANKQLTQVLHTGLQGVGSNARGLSPLQAAETIGVAGWPETFPHPLRQLLAESMRARTSAIRGDGLIVRGNIFARRIAAMGRVRLNYADVSDGLHLEGARLRSVAAVGRVLDALYWISEQKVEDLAPSPASDDDDAGDPAEERRAKARRRLAAEREARRRFPGIKKTLAEYHQVRVDTREAARGREHQKDDDFALDLREAVFGGSVIVSSHIKDAKNGGPKKVGAPTAAPGDPDAPAARAADTAGSSAGEATSAGPPIPPTPADGVGASAAAALDNDAPAARAGDAAGSKADGTRFVRPPPSPTRVDGVIAADHCEIHGDLQMVQMRVSFPPKKSYDDTARENLSPDEQLAMAADWEARKDHENLQDVDLNWGGRDPTSIRLFQAKVAGDVDLRETVDVCGIDLENAKVGGSLLFADKIGEEKPPAEDPAAPTETSPTPPPPAAAAGDPQAKALNSGASAKAAGPPEDDPYVRLVTVARRARNVSHSITLRNAEIEGDAILVFSPKRGPKIKAEFAKVSGRLDIYPQIDAIGGAAKGDPRPSDKARAIAEATFPMDYQDYRRSNSEARGTRGDLQLQEKLRRQGKRQAPADPKPRRRPKWPESWRKKTQDGAPRKERGAPGTGEFIDLRNARAAVFCHPPPAWPDQDKLSIEGFAYERSHPKGPLAPYPNPGLSRPVPRERRARRRREVAGFWRDEALLWMGRAFELQPFLAWSLSLILVVAVGATLFSPAVRTWWLSGWEPIQLVWDFSGDVHWWLVGLSALVLALHVTRWAFDPRLPQSAPMAIDYLARQRSERNRYRLPGSIYWSLDPYVRAATALREEGRAISANLLEAERLRQRTNMLSWRHHLLAKAGMLSVQLLARYGFGVSRTVTALAFVIVLAAMTASAAEHCGALTYKAELSAEAVKTGKSEPGPRFEPLWYAADLVLPFYDIDSNKAWKVTPTAGCHGRWPKAMTTLWRPLFMTLGLLLSTIAAVAVATRAESAFRRVEE